ncbi:hypothetical protein T492DRAFT_831268 [Pavlovales sp. CCMP2436]|nr:hypothetical protein T492DRAFT_831268 [Pavlovales sp. CCMP2436]
MLTHLVAVAGHPNVLALLLTVAAALPPLSLVFIKFVWVLTLGYGFAVASIGLLLLGLRRCGALVVGESAFTSQASAPLADAHACLLVAYGVRYAALMAWREVHFPEFTREHSHTESYGWPRRLRVLAIVAVLVAAETAPALLHALAPAHGCPRFVGGMLACAALGLVLETLADFEKAAFKQRARALGGGRAEAAEVACTSGLYARWRHPNYGGDLLFWLAVYAGALPSLAALLRAQGDDTSGYSVTLLLAAVATCGQLAEIAIIQTRASESEASQQRRYGASEAFRAYIRRSGSLLPKLRVGGRGRPD